MTERTPAPHPSWELAPISDALGADWDFANDPVLGTRVQFRLPAPDAFPTEVDLYPDTGLVHVATPDSHIALGRQTPPVITTDQVVFSQNKGGLTTDLTIARGGVVTLRHTPTALEDVPEASEGPVREVDSPKRRITHDTESTPADGDPGDSESPPGNGLESGDDEQGENPRVQLVGRLGSAPRFRTTQQDLLIGRFPLAVHHDDESTTWHPIVVFGERAAALQGDELKKGELVNVVGYEHERTWTDKKGDEKTEIQIYAAVIART